MVPHYTSVLFIMWNEQNLLAQHQFILLQSSECAAMNGQDWCHKNSNEKLKDEKNIKKKKKSKYQIYSCEKKKTQVKSIG